jgi:site-specific DNA-methyltransferase (adenine-specific)
MITEKRELKNVPLTDLIPYARNPRKNDPAVQRVAASLKEYGLVKNSIVVDEDMVLITGHTTTKAMQALKWATAPEVTQVFGLTEAQKKAYRIADNKLGELAAWDDELLALELDDLKVLDFDLDQTGFDDKELGKILDAGKEASEDDYEPPVEIETSIQRGDLFRLGRHRLLCGDSTSAEDVARLMGGAKEVSVLTDPPYNIGFKYNAIDDKMPESEYKAFCEAFFKNIVDAGAKGIIITPGPRNEEFYPKPKDRGIWVKRNATAGASVFHLRLCEPILFYGTFKEKRNTDLFEYSSGFTQELKDARKKRGVLEEHAPAKPIALWSDLINMLSDGVVLDLFSGNGTTLVACEQLGRTCYGMEISPQYCQVIIDRWEKLTGQKAEKIDGD